MSYREFWQSMHERVGVGELTDSLRAAVASEEAPAPAASAGGREREFMKGRVCARQALGALVYPDLAIERGPDREPVWPSGIVGSISHTSDYCVAVAARKQHLVSIGVDAEKTIPLSRRVVRKVCDEAELKQVMALPAELQSICPIVFFSAKESLFKCLFQLKRLGPTAFRDATLSVDWRQGRISVERLTHGMFPVSPEALRGHFAISERHVLTYIVCPGNA